MMSNLNLTYQDKWQLEYTKTLTAISSWPIEFQLKLLESLKTLSTKGNKGESISEIRT